MGFTETGKHFHVNIFSSFLPFMKINPFVTISSSQNYAQILEIYYHRLFQTFYIAHLSKTYSLKSYNFSAIDNIELKTSTVLCLRPLHESAAQQMFQNISQETEQNYSGYDFK